MSREGRAGGDGSLTQSHLEMAWGLSVPSQPPLEHTTDFALLLNANSFHSQFWPRQPKGKLVGGCRTSALGQDSAP